MEKAVVLYTQKGCFACHGSNYEGNQGPILAGLDAEHIKQAVRAGSEDGVMPPFDEEAISDADLDLLATFLSSLTLEDTGVELSSAIVEHLEKVWDALQAGDKAGMETHLKKAQEAAAPPAPPWMNARHNEPF